MDAAIDALRRQGHEIHDEQLAHVWPLAWDHINLTGGAMKPQAQPGEIGQPFPGADWLSQTFSAWLLARSAA